MIKTNKTTGTFKSIRNLLTMMLLVSMATIFTGCKDEVDPIVTTNTVITVISPVDGVTQISGSTITLAFTANSNNGLKRIVIKLKPSTGSETTKLDTVLSSQPSDFSFSRKYNVGSIGTETYTITVTDKKDNIETNSVNVKSITGFNEEVLGKFYHILGSNPGAFDLVKGEQRVISDSDNEKDMANTDGASVFTGAWETKNTTMFIKAVGFDYSSGTTIEAKDLYASGSPKSSISVPLAGEIYIARLRGDDSYAVIKIIANEPLNDDCGCINKGKLSFNFKKSL